MQHIQKDMAFTLADRWTRVNEDQFGGELVVHKSTGDFAIDDFPAFLEHIGATIDRQLVVQVEMENAYREKSGDPKMTREEMILLLESTVLQGSKLMIGSFSPVFTGYWRRKKHPRTLSRLRNTTRKVVQAMWPVQSRVSTPPKTS